MVHRVTQLSSKLIQSVSYAEKIFLLGVKFKSGEVYYYAYVDKKTFLALIRAKSVGAYFNRHIRNVYPFEKIS